MSTPTNTHRQSTGGINIEDDDIEFFVSYNKPIVNKDHILYPPAIMQHRRIARRVPPGYNTVFITGCPEHMTEEILRHIFEMCGKVICVNMGKYGSSNKSVQFMEEKNVAKAVNLTGWIVEINIDGRYSFGTLSVGISKPTEDSACENQEKESLPVQQSSTNKCFQASAMPEVPEGMGILEGAVGTCENQETETLPVQQSSSTRYLQPAAVPEVPEGMGTFEGSQSGVESVPPFTLENVEVLKGKFRNEATYDEAVKTLNTWLARGEINSTNNDIFYELLGLMTRKFESGYQAFLADCIKKIVHKNEIEHRRRQVDEILTILLRDLSTVNAVPGLKPMVRRAVSEKLQDPEFCLRLQQLNFTPEMRKYLRDLGIPVPERNFS